LVVLGDKPLVVETPPHLLDNEVTPNDVMFIRNNGLVPANIDASTWTLSIGSEATPNSPARESESTKRTVTFTLAELKRTFKHYTRNILIECGGNGRSEFNPPAKGNQWTLGGVGCPVWTGVRLKDVLQYVGLHKDAVYIGYYGADVHLSGDTNKVAISRGVPIQKALEDDALIVWEMNGVPLPIEHGYPLRLVIPGYPASVSGKWLNRIVVRNKVHDGAKMVDDYRNPCSPVEPGSDVPNSAMCVIEEMPVKSLITYPETGSKFNFGDKVEIRGNAWSGIGDVKEVFVSIDFGATWVKANLRKPLNKFAWQRFSAHVNFPSKGYYELWARAVDKKGVSQPMVIPGWNPKGYLNNATHRIGIKIV
jgi:sulfite oxidase